MSCGIVLSFFATFQSYVCGREVLTNDETCMYDYFEFNFLKYTFMVPISIKNYLLIHF